MLCDDKTHQGDVKLRASVKSCEVMSIGSTGQHGKLDSRESIAIFEPLLSLSGAVSYLYFGGRLVVG